MTYFKKLLLATVFVVPVLTHADFQGKVVGVSDGDTITVLVNGREQRKVRLNNIDAPESKQAYGQRAKQAMSNMVYGKTVFVATKKQDRYGRYLGEVYLPPNSNVNKSMVEYGFAWAYREYLSDQSYLDLEYKARANKAGLWADPHAMYPQDFRKRNKRK